MYLSVDIPERVVPIRISLRVAANKEYTKARVPSGTVVLSLS